MNLVNVTLEENEGYAQEEVIGLNPGALVKSNIQDKAFYESLWATILAKKNLAR